MNSPLFYLASSSPRRRQLLDQIGARYRVIAVNVDETPMAAEVGAEYVIRLALAKARAGQEASGDGLPVLGADTALTLDQRILGKPRDRHDALEMLMALSGRVHKVMTALAWVDPQREDTRLSVSRVEFCAFDKASAEAYVASGEPLDKAGGYGIQGLGALLVARLEGSYSGVMGLPLYETGQLLRRAGYSPLP